MCSFPLAVMNSSLSSQPKLTVLLRFMIEGFDHDDRYRMVEDELLFIAGTFTKHLHAAEYQRLKTLASSRNAETIESISRPVTGSMADLVKRRQAAVSLAASQHRGLKKALGKRSRSRTNSDSDAKADSPGPDLASTSLQFLMNSPRKKNVPISAVVGNTTSSRVTAGIRDGNQARRPMLSGAPVRATSGPEPRSRSHIILQEQVDSTESDSDDLDAQPTLPSRLAARSRSANRLDTASPDARQARVSPLDQGSLRRVRTIESDAKALGTSRTPTSSPSENTYDDEILDRIQKRRLEQKRRRESSEVTTGKKSGRSSLDTIPLF